MTIALVLFASCGGVLAALFSVVAGNGFARVFADFFTGGQAASLIMVFWIGIGKLRSTLGRAIR